MTSPAVKAWTSFLLVAIALYGGFTIWKVYKAQSVATANDRERTATPISAALPPVPLEKFTFIDSEGEPFPMERLAGKVWVASYFFATCPGFCLQMNQEIAKIVRDLAGKDVTFVSFTVDPENDTPAELKSYAERMQADGQRWVFLTGKQADIQELGQQYLKMPATKEHNDKLVLVGRDARVYVNLPRSSGFFSSRNSRDVEKLRQEIAECIAKDPPNAPIEKVQRPSSRDDAKTLKVYRPPHGSAAFIESRPVGAYGLLSACNPGFRCASPWAIEYDPFRVGEFAHSPCRFVSLPPCLRGSAAEAAL